MTASRPIPDFLDPDFQAVRIQESGEPVTQLHPGDGFHVYPAYHARGFVTAEPSVYLRSGVIDTLRTVVRALPKGINIVVFDGLRSLQTQKEIADRFAATLTNTQMSDEERVTLISRFVAPLPSTEEAYRSRPPSHATGAAVDLSLANPDGTPMDLGADFDQFDDTATTTYYEHVCANGPCSADDLARRDLRRTLYWAMIGAGFAPYPDEYWHFEIGTQRAAAFYRMPLARYGASVTWPQEYRAVA